MVTLASPGGGSGDVLAHDTNRAVVAKAVGNPGVSVIGVSVTFRTVEVTVLSDTWAKHRPTTRPDLGVI